jgi:hypothetical protein
MRLVLVQRERETMHGQITNSLCHHDLGELVVVDLAVSVDVRLAQHLGELVVGESLAEVLEDVAQLIAGDEAVLILVEDAELVVGAGVAHLAGEEDEELVEVDGAAAVGVHLRHHLLQLRLRGALPQRPHHRAQLLARDRPCSVRCHHW